LTRNSPEEFSKYLQYCRNLNFEERPDYNYLRGLFRGLMDRSGYTNDGAFDWILKKEGNTAQLRQQQMQEERKAPLPGRIPAQA